MKISNDKLIKMIDDNLNKIFSNSQLVNSLNSVSFCDLVLKQISILKFVEEKENKGSKNKSDKWLDKLNKLNNSTLTLSNLNYHSNEAALDDVNYIKVYIQNVFKLDLDNLEKGDENDVEQVTATPYNAAAGATVGAGAASETSSSNPSFNPFASPYGSQGSMEQYIYFAANTRFTQEVMSNKFYVYKTKPKAVPIVKIIMGIILLILSLMIVAKIVLSAIVGNFPITVDSGEQREFAFANYNLASDILFILAALWLAYTYLKKQNNDNYKYYIDWKRSSFLMVLFVFFVIYYLINYVDLLAIENKWVVNDQEKNLILITIYLTFAGVGVFFGYIVFYIISVACLNPKYDGTRCQMRINQIVEEVKNEMSKSGARI